MVRPNRQARHTVIIQFLPAGRRDRLLRGIAGAALSTSLACAASPAAMARQQPQPEPAPDVPPIQAPQDRPYPGTITLRIDATDLDRHIFTAHETIPVSGSGDTVLLFPRWVPGDHSPTGQIDKFASLVIHAGGTRLAWVRDPVDVYAFHVPVPQGASALDLDFQYLSPVVPNEGRVVMTPSMLSLQANEILLYPAGIFSRDLPFDMTVTYPAGWTAFAGLDVASQQGAVVHYKTVGLNTLVDNPILAGRYVRREDLSPPATVPGGAAPVHLDVAGDVPDDLAISPAVLQAYRNLVVQEQRLFGSHHYDHYDFLLSVSDQLGDIGEEHHRSSENGEGADDFTAWDKNLADRDLLPHESTHSWNGKFRRPFDLWQPNFNTPERDTLLWVYEGQTEYWGKILSARSGLWSKQDGLDQLADMAATYDNGVGRSWRDLEDTTNDPIIAERRPIPWRGWQRSEDYYDEGALVWLDVDTKLRELSHGTKSLNDFARGFFGMDNGSYVVRTYVFADVVSALDAVAPFDWAGFLRTRLDGVGGQAPLDGITRGGYRLVYTAVESPYEKSAAGLRKMTDLGYSLGLFLTHDGAARGVIWGSPAYKAGISVGTEIVAVNGAAFDPDDLLRAITDAKTTKAPIELLLKAQDHYRTVRIDYHGGLRYPHLERIPGSTGGSLDAILAPLN